MQVQVSLKIDISASASLQQIEEQIQEAGRESMRQALKQSIRAWEEQHRRCPRGDQRDTRVEGSIRRMLGALFGRVALELRARIGGRRFARTTRRSTSVPNTVWQVPIQSNRASRQSLLACSMPGTGGFISPLCAIPVNGFKFTRT